SSAPLCDIRFLDLLAGFRCKKMLQELQYGRMVKHLRTDISAAVPGRRNYHRNAEPQADRTSPCSMSWVGGQILLQRDVFHCSVDTGGRSARLRFARMRYPERRYVIEVSIVLVVSQDEDRFLPHLRIVSENVHHFRDIPGPKPRCSRMIRVVFRSNQPGHRRQIAVMHIFAELIEDVALGDFY